ncbi:MAG: hypothetical protein ABJB05_04985 [Parafilimonas sp.]
MRKIFTLYKANYVIMWLLVFAGFITAQAAAGDIKTAKKPVIIHHQSQKQVHPITKIDTSGENNVDQPAGVNYPIIYTNLLVSSGNTYFLTDGVAAVFSNKFSAAVDGDDAIKLWNFGENIALVRGNYMLAAEFRPVPVLRDTLFYRLYLKQRPYTLQIFTQDFAGVPAMHTWLVDTYLHTKTAVNLTDTTLYNFTPNKDTTSYRNRFMLVFDKKLIATPVTVAKIINEDV